MGVRSISNMPAGAYLPAAEVKSRVVSVLQGMRYVDVEKVQDSSALYKDLGLDGVARGDLFHKLESEFRVSFPTSGVSTVGEIVSFVASNPRAK